MFIHPFMTIWLGENFSFNRTVEILIVLHFFLTFYRRPILTLISVYGLSYEQNKKSYRRDFIKYFPFTLLFSDFRFRGIWNFIGYDLFNSLDLYMV